MIREFLEFIGVYSVYHRWLKETIRQGEVPKHIGVITDGNRRWAKARLMEGWEGHWEGAKTLESFLDWCIELGVETVTIYSFSTENFNRSPEELDELFKVFQDNLEKVLRSSIQFQQKIGYIFVGSERLCLICDGLIVIHFQKPTETLVWVAQREQVHVSQS